MECPKDITMKPVNPIQHSIITDNLVQKHKNAKIGNKHREINFFIIKEYFLN